MPPYAFSGRRFKDYRRQAGLLEEHVAVAVFRRARTIARYEDGSLMPPADMVAKLAAVVGVKPGDLYVLADSVSA